MHSTSYLEHLESPTFGESNSMSVYLQESPILRESNFRKDQLLESQIPVVPYMQIEKPDGSDGASF